MVAQLDLFDKLNEIIIFLTEDFSIRWLNQSALDFFHCQKDVVINKNYIEFCKNSNQQYPSFFDGVTNPINIKSRKKIEQVTYDSMVIEWELVSLLENRNFSLMLIGRDKTDYENMLINKQDIENRIKSIINALPGNFWWKDLNGRYIGCNENLSERLQLSSPDYVIGKTDFELPWAENAGELVKHDNEVINSEKMVTREEDVTTLLGKLLHFLVVKTPLWGSQNSIIGTIGVSLDITKLKKTELALKEAKEKAEAANQAKSQFLAMISHELRTPLNGILGMSAILSNTTLTDEQKSHVADITTSGNTLLALVNDVLDFTKLRSGKFNLSIKTFNVNKAIHHVIKNTLHQVENQDIELRAVYADDVPLRVVGDELRVTQILINLVNNAIKYTKKGHITIKVDLIAASKEKATIQISVEDSGIGIPEDKLDHVFERFAQLEVKDYKRKYRGIGLGLSICQQLIALMGGEISVKSEVGIGSTFQFTIPFPLPQENATSSEEDKQNELADVQPAQFNHHILVVEDELINQTIISIMLKELGCTFQLAKNGKEALEHFRNNTYDFILMDIQLPDMNGMEITKEIRTDELKNGTQQIPIIAHTAHAFDEEHKKFIASGMNGVVTKPISSEKLRAALTKYVKKPETAYPFS